ncbi:MAG TPA: polyprenyl synthetase family protein [Ruminococcaceae bacterium]|nr:polyprenyl synthetase family protein [Oscillospiraceae bacterium]
MDYAKQYQEYLARANQALEKACETFLPEESEVCRAARYSLLGGGKRIRAVLVLAVCDMLNGSAEAAEQFAAAVEMLHCYSLIHDDLPCMDNDDLRRGKPSCHKAFGEANALLAGDALAILPAQVIAEAGLKGTISQSAALKIIALLGEQAGIYGMIGGQVIDTENEGKQLPENVLLEMYRMKTGALLEFCCRAGVIAAGGGAELQLAAGTYARKLGLAFQIIDDILDVTADENQLGKPVGSDADSGKYTYAAVVGLDRARAEAARLTDEAVQALEPFADREFLTGLTKLLLDRKY